MLQQLTGQLAPMLSAAAAASSAAASLAGGAASGRRLREVGEQPRSADRLKALAARFQGLRDSRIALRDWLAAERANRSTKGSPASSGTSGSQRRLRQEDGAREAAPPLLVEGAPSDQSFRGKELPPLLLVLEGDEAGDMPLWQDGYLIIEVGWVQSSVCPGLLADRTPLLLGSTVCPPTVREEQECVDWCALPLLRHAAPLLPPHTLPAAAALPAPR
jgi:hypothetical protein